MFTCWRGTKGIFGIEAQPRLGLTDKQQLTQGRRSCLTPTLGFEAEPLRGNCRLPLGDSFTLLFSPHFWR